MSAIYSESFCNFLQPRAQFTRRGGRTFSELHGVDHATTIRAIADIWFPGACEFENPRQQRVNQKPRPRKGTKETLIFHLRENLFAHEASNIADQTSSMSVSSLVL